MSIEILFSYITLFLNFISSLIDYKILTKEKIQINFCNILHLILFPVFSLIISYTSVILLKLVMNIFFILVLIKMFYKSNLKKSLYFTTIISIIFLISDMLISILIVNNKYLINFSNFREKYYLRSILIIPVCLLSVFISSLRFLIKYTNEFFNKLFSKKKSNDLIFHYLIFMGLLISLLSCLNAYNNVNRIGHLIIVISALLLIVVSIFTLIFIYTEYQTKILNRNIVEENKYMKDIARQDKKFKHNLINNLLGIKTVASKKVNQLIDELISEYKTDYKNILNINDLPDGILSIIYRKAYEENIENLNLAVDNKIKKDLIDMLSPKNYNKFCTSIGILFDNALDAVKSCKEKIIEINFLEDEEYIYYIQKNSFNNTIDLERTGTKEYTTKKSGHGIGLNYVKNLKNIETKNELINNMFITKLKVKKIKM